MFVECDALDGQFVVVILQQQRFVRADVVQNNLKRFKSFTFYSKARVVHFSRHGRRQEFFQGGASLEKFSKFLRVPPWLYFEV